MDLFELRDLCVALIGVDMACALLAEEDAVPLAADRTIRNRIGDIVGAAMHNGVARVEVRGTTVQARIPGQQWAVPIFERDDITVEAEQLWEAAS